MASSIIELYVDVPADRQANIFGQFDEHLKLIERIMGALLVVVGLALLTGAFPSFAYWLLETFPWLAALG